LDLLNYLNLLNYLDLLNYYISQEYVSLTPGF
jgi:hypothetical protein